MESLTKNWVTDAHAKLVQNNTHCSFRTFLPQQLNLEGQWQVSNSEKSRLSWYQNIREETFIFLHTKLQKSSEVDYLEPGLY